MTGPQTPSVFTEWGFGLQDYFLPSHSCRSKSEGAEVEVSSALVLINQNNTRISRHYICSPFLVWFLSLALLAWVRLSPLLVPCLAGALTLRIFAAFALESRSDHACGAMAPDVRAPPTFELVTPGAPHERRSSTEQAMAEGKTFLQNHFLVSNVGIRRIGLNGQ